MIGRQPIYPEGYSEGSLTWTSLLRAIVDGQSDLWFQQFEVKPLKECFKKESVDFEGDSKIAFDKLFLNLNNYKLIPSISSSISERDFEEVAIEDSELGKSLLRNLDSLGVRFELQNTLLITDQQLIEIPTNFATTGNTPWGTYFQDRFQQSFKIYKYTSGEEVCYWYSDVLYGTRADISYTRCEFLKDPNNLDSGVFVELSSKEMSKPVFSFNQWSTKFHLPWIAKLMFYLSETPFPSSLASFSRNLAYPDLDESKLPQPYLQILNQEQVMCSRTSIDINGKAEYRGINTIAPQLVRMGWLFNASDLESQKIILTTITEALVKINSFFQDGYLNHNNPEDMLCFDQILFSTNQLERKYANQGTQGCYSRWIPVPHVFELLERTEGLLNGLNNPLKSAKSSREDLICIVDEGVGRFPVASAINTAIFSHLIPDKAWGAIDFYAQNAAMLNATNESTNAISNWGISKFLAGDLESAKLLFSQALERPDKYAEDEASFYMSKISEKEGDLKAAKQWMDRCNAAGGYEPSF